MRLRILLAIAFVSILATSILLSAVVLAPNPNAANVLIGNTTPIPVSVGLYTNANGTMDFSTNRVVERIQTAGFKEVTIHYYIYAPRPSGGRLALAWDCGQNMERHGVFETINLPWLGSEYSFILSKTYNVQGPALVITGEDLNQMLYDVQVSWYLTT